MATGRATKRAVKALRAHPAVNVPLTSTLKRVLPRPYPAWVITHLPRSGVARVLLPNGRELKLWSRGDDWISTQIFWRGWEGYEPETVPMFFALAAEASVTVDVGAYVGYLSVMAALANPRGRVIAVEPFPATIERLERNVALNDLTNVTVVPVAAGARAGTGELHHLDHPGYERPMSASLDAEHLEAWGTRTLSVPVRPLDDLLSTLDVDRIDLLKLDTERTEAEVLEGAQRLLQRDHPHVICEVLARPDVGDRLSSLLGPLGYRFYELRADAVVEHAQIPSAQNGNYLFSTADPLELPFR